MDKKDQFIHKKSLWEKFQDQKEEPWPFLDFNEFKTWYGKQELLRNNSDSRNGYNLKPNLHYEK